ncbi:putative choline transporter, neither null mutation nor overexpression affects choline transport, partial [Coelomomyces lativittatus]
NTSQKVFFFIFVAWLLFIWFGIRRLVPFTAVLLRAVINIIKKYSGPFWCNLIIFFIGFSYVVFLILLALVAQRTFLNYPASETPFEHHLVAGCVFAYLLFSFYWTLQVLKNVAHVTVAGAFASYYFSNPAMDRFPTLNALKRALTTSFGSICYGSLIISMIQWLHVVIKEGFQWSSNDGNQVSSFIFCCLECLNNFIEDCAQPLNTYTFIQVAMYGKPYQRAAKDTWRLIRDRGVDVLINNLCIEIVLGIGFCFVCILTVFTTMATCYIFSLSDLEWDFSINPIIIGGVIGGGTLVYLFSEIIRTGVSTTMVVLAEDPLALKNSKPELWEEIRRVYPEVAYISMYHL